MSAARRFGARQPKTRQATRHAPVRKPVDKQSLYVRVVIGIMVVGALVVILLPPNPGPAVRYRIETERGAIVLDVFPSAVPGTAANFERLVADKFYDGLTFHRIEDWVAQGGDNGLGGPGWTIPLETSRKLHHVRGAVGMARLETDINSASAQFYILKKDQRNLDGHYAVFAKVVEGMDVVDKLEAGDKMVTVTKVTPVTP
jgi:peptidyl-prolyl cis-trans isomerase B (cyclophilin B)